MYVCVCMCVYIYVYIIEMYMHTYIYMYHFGCPWNGLGLELACGMVGWLGLGLLPVVVHVIIPLAPLWNGWGFGFRGLGV